MYTTSAWRQQTPRDWEHYVNKQVRVTAHGQQQHRGWLHTVDPVTASVVLVQLGESAGGCSVSVVMGHAVEQVEVVGEADEETAMRLSSLFRSEELEARGGEEEVKRRREELRGWLQQNRVPVEEVGEDLLVAGVLTVRPPYAEHDCFSSNQMVLARIQGLLARMPTAQRSCDQPADDGQQSCDQPSCDQPAAAGQQSCDQPADDGQQSCDQPADDGQQSCDQPADDGERSCDQPADDGRQSCDQPADDGERSCDQPADDGQQSCDQPAAGF